MNQQEIKTTFKKIDDMNILLQKADEAYDTAIAAGKLEEELVQLWTNSEQIKRKLQDLQTKLLDFMQANNKQVNVRAMEDETEEKKVEDVKFIAITWDDGDNESSFLTVRDGDVIEINEREYKFSTQGNGARLTHEDGSVFNLPGHGLHKLQVDIPVWFFCTSEIPITVSEMVLHNEPEELATAQGVTPPIFDTLVFVPVNGGCYFYEEGREVELEDDSTYFIQTNQNGELSLENANGKWAVKYGLNAVKLPDGRVFHLLIQAHQPDRQTLEAQQENINNLDAPQLAKFDIVWCAQEQLEINEGLPLFGQTVVSPNGANGIVTILEMNYPFSVDGESFTLSTDHATYRLPGLGVHVVNLVNTPEEDQPNLVLVSISEHKAAPRPIVVPVPVEDHEETSDERFTVVVHSPEDDIEKEDIENGVSLKMFGEDALDFYFVGVGPKGISLHYENDTKLAFPGREGYHTFRVQREDGTMGEYGIFVLPEDTKPITITWNEDSDEDSEPVNKRKRSSEDSRPSKRHCA
jgi:hypothetical protein